ncbi:MAG: transglycosylase SLT domain-containing protein, partial [Pseudomonadota bacterium]|nr:transglycosylase SLT domain-containing protein [Pseudomonadota bacterium]
MLEISSIRRLLLALLLLAPMINGVSTGAEAPDIFAHPPELEPDVRFWIRVYTEVTTDQGLLHDDWDLGLVYEVLRFDPADSPRQRERIVAQAKARYAELLRRFASGATDNLTAHEGRILHAFGEKPTPAQFRGAIERIRFQLGQADRFHEGLLRAQAYEASISRVLADRGVPAEIGALPHVESSFNPAAYSRVGAAGLWQFMPGTARRYMRVDGLVDQRLDPYSATEAAANLMLYNYRLLGSWPLAVTAYNHGPGGLRRAQEELGSSNIEVIVKRYQGATFGFASRNFYVAFLAALEVDRNAEKYFGPLTHLPDAPSSVVVLPDYIPVDALAKAFKADLGALRVLNPALRPPIWNKARFVPRGYALRLPGMPQPSDIAAAWARLPPTERYLVQRNDGPHRVRRGETLASIAAAGGVPVNRLLAANGWTGTRELVRGEIVRIPIPASRAEAAGTGPAALAAGATATVAT